MPGVTNWIVTPLEWGFSREPSSAGAPPRGRVELGEDNIISVLSSPLSAPRDRLERAGGTWSGPLAALHSRPVPSPLKPDVRRDASVA